MIFNKIFIFVFVLSITHCIALSPNYLSTTLETLKKRQPGWTSEVINIYPDGVVESELFFDKGIAIKQLQFDPIGALKSETDLNQIAHGASVWYTNLGKIAKVLSYRMGKEDGPCEIYYENGSLKSQKFYREGKLYGFCCDWFENGNLLGSGHYLDEKREGVFKTFYSTGSLKSYKLYKNGVLHGEVKEWNKHGQLIQMEYYTLGLLQDQNGMPAHTLYYPDKMVQERQSFLMGRPHGRCICYYPNGQKKYLVTYSNGKKTGVENYFSEKGKLIGFARYSDCGKPIGKHYFLHPNEQIAQVANYDQSGALIEPIQEFDEEGNLRAKYIIIKGSLEGIFERYFDSARLKSRFSYKNGELDGRQEVWFPSGALKVRAHYRDGLKEGSYQKWFSNGQLQLSTVYSEGKIINTLMEWYENGQLKEELPFKNKLRSGFHRKWNCKGICLYELQYQLGIPMGELKEWSDGGKCIHCCRFLNGKLEGRDEHYFGNGRLKSLKNYRENLLEGEAISWFESGSIREKGFYKNGKAVGEHLTFFDSSALQKVASIAHYMEGFKIKEQVQFFSNGKKKSCICYDRGVLNGRKAIWDSSGNLIEEVYYNYGLLDHKRKRVSKFEKASLKMARS